jgi:hypothetical protein
MEPRSYIDARGARSDVRVIFFETDSGFKGRIELAEQIMGEKIIDALIKKEIENARKLLQEAKK